jgi:hypothetical protein
MRLVFAALLTTIALSSGASTANALPYDPYPWCAEYGGGGRGGGTNCYFMTYEQCRWALSGNGGLCRRNLFYTGPAYGDDYGHQARYRHRSY